MKIIFIVFLLIFALLPINIIAQDKIDKLSDKVDKLADQVAETNKQILELTKQTTENNKQIAIVATRVDSLEKSTKERLDMQSNFMISIIGLVGILFVAILGFIGFILWDRRTAVRPVETKVTTLEKEVKELKERETKLENLIKKLLEKHPDLANLANF